MPWQPLLTGSAALAARRISDAIADSFREPQRCAPLFWEAALFFGYRALATGDEEDQRHCSSLIALAHQNPPTSPALWGGLAGLGWAIVHLRSLGLVVGHEALLRAIDRALLRHVQEGPEEFDLIGGLAGIGLYASARLPQASALLEATIHQLALRSESLGPGRAWRTSAENALPGRPAHPDGYFDLGVAHGAPGVLPVLSAAVRAGVACEQASALRDALLASLLDSGLADPQGFSAYGAPLAETISLPSWCYGHPGVGSVLLAHSPPDSEVHRIAHQLAAQWAHRVGEPAAHEDLHLCHGSAGIAHLLARQSLHGDPTLRQAALHGYQRLLGGLGAPGYEEFSSASERARASAMKRPCLLDGTFGVGLALLAGVEHQDPAWDFMLGVSCAPPEERTPPEALPDKGST